MKKFYDLQNNPHELPEGEQIYVRISCYSVIKNTEGKLLMVMPQSNNQWEFPGGGEEIDETIEEALIRECYEETGYRIRIKNERHVYVGETNFYSSKKRRYYHSVLLFYEAELISERQDRDAIRKDEIEQVEWKSLTELTRENVRSVYYPVIKILKAE